MFAFKMLGTGIGILLNVKNNYSKERKLNFIFILD